MVCTCGRKLSFMRQNNRIKEMISGLKRGNLGAERKEKNWEKLTATRPSK